MPPRYMYWTILIDNRPTAFRAREAAELLPTLHQLRRKNASVEMKWFARGRLWESPEAERAARRQPRQVETRGRDWRPGGEHRDPRARFDHKKKPRPPSSRPPSSDRPWSPGSKRTAAGAAAPRRPFKRESDRRREAWRGPKPQGPPTQAPKPLAPRAAAPRRKWRGDRKPGQPFETQSSRRRKDEPDKPEND